MNILYIGFDIEGVGGIATYSRHQIRALRDLGHKLFVLSIDKQETIVEGGIADHHIPFGDKYRAVPRVLSFLWSRRREFDVTFVNHVFLAGFGLALRTLTGAPYVLNVYNIDILTELATAREYAFTRANLVIADCQYTIDHLPKYHGRVPRTGLLYDPVDTKFFRPIAKAEARQDIARRFELPDLTDRFVIVTIASLLLPPNKGHRQTIEALAKLNDPRMLYLIVGKGPDRDAIAEHAERHGVSEQVKLLGLVDQAALPFLYSAADVAVLVSRGGKGWGEAVPLGLIEASASATAFICGNEDGSVEAIDKTRPNGFAIAPDDIAALADKLRELADSPALSTGMGSNGKRVVDDIFAYDKFVHQQGAILAPILARSGRRPAAKAA
jgi:glycosyltransferase involved in cell wall biosynthesis